MSKRVKIGETQVAGEGADGHTYGVTRINGEGVYMRRPCATCPWRQDAMVGRFPAQAYRESANTAEDMSGHMFACHTAGTENPATCAGFLLRNANHNLAVRLALMSGRIDLREVSDGGTGLYGSYREMAVANGVSPHDPALARCRANDE